MARWRQLRFPVPDRLRRSPQFGLAITSAGIFDTGLFDLHTCKSLTGNLQVCQSDRGLNDAQEMWNHFVLRNQFLSLSSWGGNFAA